MIKWIKSLIEKIFGKFCKKCNHLCHCIESDHEKCSCENCECKPVKETHSEGLVIDDTDECLSCQ